MVLTQESEKKMMCYKIKCADQLSKNLIFRVPVLSTADTFVKLTIYIVLCMLQMSMLGEIRVLGPHSEGLQA